jgi:ribosomal protein S18 acetylase RimI-like enzyme
MPEDASVQIRPFETGDRDAVMAIAPRLTEGVAAWRDPVLLLRAVREWVQGAVDSAGKEDHAFYVAVAGDRVVGLVGVSERKHFTGQVDGYVGELAVASGWERRGIATQLMGAAESWAAGRGLAFITLDTGAANRPARSLYTALGFLEEDVLLTKPLPAAGQH